MLFKSDISTVYKVFINAEIGKNKVKKSKDLGAFYYDILLRLGLLSQIISAFFLIWDFF